MRLRLVHILALMLLLSVLIAVVAMGAVTAWNLKNGFADYLMARDTERLERFADHMAQAAEQQGGLAALRDNDPGMRRLLQTFAQREGLPQAARSSGPPNMGGQDAPPPAAHVPPGGSEGFGPRVMVVGLDGKPLFFRPRQVESGEFIEQPIRLRGEVVAVARLRVLARVSDSVDLGFLRRQYAGILGVSSVLMLLALFSAWWIGRRWAMPLQAAQQTVARLARGELDARVEIPARDAKRSDEIGDLLRNINHMAEGLQKLERTRRRWLADISHELRTPLSVLRGEIEALTDAVRPLTREAILSLREEVFQLNKLVDDLHLLAVSDLQALPCVFGELDASDLLGQVTKRFAESAADKNLILSFKPPSPLPSQPPLHVRWDSARIEQLLSNLLENSLRYTDSQGHIQLGLTQQTDRILITLDDSAPGVAAADLPRLFEPLYRADAARSRHHGGSGLGLAICEAIVHSHGGQISAHASALGGLQVRIELPCTARVNA